METYFGTLIGTAVDPDRNGIQALRGQLDFPAVAEKFRMIEEDTYDLIVEYPNHDAGRIARLVEQLRTREKPPRLTLRELQPHTVSMHQREAHRMQQQGWIDPIMPSLGVWIGQYDPVRGLVGANRDLII